MDPFIILSLVLVYFLALTVISYFTGKGANSDTFFTGNRKSPWYAVAYGMIGASLSGVTFVSVPGWVASTQFSYMQMVFGYLVGYFFIATVLLPLYYRLNLTSIYTYLEQRFGFWSYKMGAFYFLLSRTIGASFRLFLVASILQLTIFDQWNIPFYVTVSITIALIWLYTFRGGIKTVVWTDTLQTTFMLLSVAMTIWLIAKELNWGFSELVQQISNSSYSKTFFFDDWTNKNHFVKQFLSGAFIAIVMTGLDQDMMQKNLTCKSLKDAQKNMFSFSIVLIFVNAVFLVLGALLYLFAAEQGIAIPEKTDHLFPLIATGGAVHPLAGILFILGLVAAAYSSADSALTALTTSFCVDFLSISKYNEKKKDQLKKWVHVGMSLLLFTVILLFNRISDESVISQLFKAAGYTYGPLLGLYAFGLFTRFKIRDSLVLIPVITAPVLCYVLNEYSKEWLNGYNFGFELLILNGIFTFIGLFLIRNGKIKKQGRIVGL